MDTPISICRIELIYKCSKNSKTILCKFYPIESFSEFSLSEMIGFCLCTNVLFVEKRHSFFKQGSFSFSPCYPFSRHLFCISRSISKTEMEITIFKNRTVLENCIRFSKRNRRLYKYHL